MATETHCCTFTRGEFFIRDAAEQCIGGVSGIGCGIGKSFKKIGNVSSGLIEIMGSVLGKENEFNPADPDSRVEVLGVSLTLSVSCTSHKNLREALISEKTEQGPSSYAQDFALCDSIEEGDFFNFDKKGVDPESVIISLVHNASVVGTLVPEIDYLVNSSGVQIMRDGIDLNDAQILRFNYDYDDTGFYDFSLLSAKPKYKEIYFKGINYAEGSETLFDAQFYRVLFAPINQMDLITRDEFLTINLTGSVEKQDSQWFKITKQE